MATYQQLQDDIQAYLNRRDAASRIPSWVSGVDTKLKHTLRTRYLMTKALQDIDAAYITLPTNFATMASIRDAATGEQLILVDSWQHTGWSDWVNGCTAYRIAGDCIEFLPHPDIPNPPYPEWAPQQVMMEWYKTPAPLVLPSDTNEVLENDYHIYLYGVLSYAGVFEQDEAMAQIWDTKFQQEVTQANLHAQQSTFSGAPYTQEMSGVF